MSIFGGSTKPPLADDDELLLNTYKYRGVRYECEAALQAFEKAEEWADLIKYLQASAPPRLRRECRSLQLTRSRIPLASPITPVRARSGCKRSSSGALNR